MSENRNSSHRHFSCLMKSCFPNPQDPLSPISAATRTAQRKTTTADTPSAAATTTINSRTDDLLLEILSLLPLPSLAFASSVCRHWSHLLDSPSFLHLRRRRSLLRPTLFTFSSSSDSGPISASLHLHLHLHSTSIPQWKITFPPNHPTTAGDDALLLLHSLFSHARPASIGRKIYLLGRDSTAELDPWTSAVRLLPATLFPRKKFAAAGIAGKLYVAGGSSKTSAVEEFDPTSSSWRVVSHAPRKRYGCIGVGMDGIFYVVGGLKIGPSASVELPRASPAAAESRVYASSMDLYDVEGRSWLRSRGVPGGGCVVAAATACGGGAAGDGRCYLYVLVSHAVELSFWKFDAARRKTTVPGLSASASRAHAAAVYGDGDVGGGGLTVGGGGGEWCRMKSPPLPTQMRLDGTVRFGCTGVGEKVVLVQVTVDDPMRRSGRTTIARGGVGGGGGGVVMMFDCVTEEWSRGPDLPDVILRSTCVCVEC